MCGAALRSPWYLVALLPLTLRLAHAFLRRGPSAILLRVSGHFLLMDCGEGTWGQLLRWFGPAGAKAVVSQRVHHSTPVFS